MLKIIYRLCVTRRLRFPLNRRNIFGDFNTFWRAFWPFSQRSWSPAFYSVYVVFRRN